MAVDCDAGTEPPGGRPAASQVFIERHIQVSSFTHGQHLTGLAAHVLHNLQYQHRWSSLRIHDVSPLSGAPLPRPLVSGLPPSRLYIHPDEQIELLRAEAERKKRLKNNKRSQDSAPKAVGTDSRQDNEKADFAEPEREWVLPTHLREKWSLERFAEVFDSITMVPPAEDEDGTRTVWDGVALNKWRNLKRVLLATISDDSTIVYYIVHDGLVKPRQN